MKKNSEWSKLFVPFLVINASSDMVWKCNRILDNHVKPQPAILVADYSLWEIVMQN